MFGREYHENYKQTVFIIGGNRSRGNGLNERPKKMASKIWDSLNQNYALRTGFGHSGPFTMTENIG